MSEYGNYGENNPPVGETETLKVVPFKPKEETDEPTYDDIDADLVLDAAKGKLDASVVIGITKDGDLYYAMSSGSLAENLLMLETARLILNQSMMPREEYE